LRGISREGISDDGNDDDDDDVGRGGRIISPLPDSNRHMTINDVMAFQNMTGREFHTTTNGTLVLLLLLRNNGILVIIVVGLV
jgi:hypothetical protein